MGHVGVIQAGNPGTKPSDAELVARVRAGDDAAFEQLYGRYQRRIRGFVGRRVGDFGRAEDLTQETFLSALRHLRSSDAPIHFKPWLFEIARNAAIDAHRRSSRVEELPVHHAASMRPADQHRLVGGRTPESELAAKERLDHLGGAFDELPPHHHRALVMRELEGRSYREIGERLRLTRPAVESALFRARRRLEHEYEELAAGRRCESARTTIGLMVEGADVGAERRRLARHARRCSACRRHARELGVEPLPILATLKERAAALVPLPWLLGRRGGGIGPAGGSLGGAAESGGGYAGALALGSGANVGAALAERAAALLAAAALAGAGGAALSIEDRSSPAGGPRQAGLESLPLGGVPGGAANPLSRPPFEGTRGGQPPTGKRTGPGRRAERESGGRGAKRDSRRRGAERESRRRESSGRESGGGAERDGRGGRADADGQAPGAPRSSPGGRDNGSRALPALPRLGGGNGAPVANLNTATGLSTPTAVLQEAPAVTVPELPRVPAPAAELLGQAQQRITQSLP